MHSVAEFRAQARRRLPRAIFDNIDGGADGETALRANEAAFQAVRLLPRVLHECAKRELGTSLLGVSYKAPFGVGPMGMGNMAWPGTDEALMNACAAAGIPYALSAA